MRFLWRGETVKEIAQPPFEAVVDFEEGQGGVLRVVAELEDGSELEDAVLIHPPGYAESMTVVSRQLVVAATRNGGPIVDLRPEELIVREQAAEFPVQAVTSAADLPLALALVIDASRSRSFRFQEDLAASLSDLEKSLALQVHEIQVVAFKERPALLAGPLRHFEEAQAAIRRLAPGGGTALYDSLLFAAYQLQASPGRRAILAITDGQDTASRVSLALAVEKLRKLGTPVFLIVPGFWQVATKSERQQRLAILAEGTSGAMFFPGREQTWRESMREIRSRLDHQVMVSYGSRGGIPDAVEYRGSRSGMRLVLLGANRTCSSP